MGLLSKVFGEIARPFSSKGIFYKAGNDLIGRNSFIGRGYNAISDFGEKAGAGMGIHTAAVTDANMARDAAERAARKAAHDAEVAKLSENALGSVNIRRRRGSSATRLTGTPTMGASPASTGKTMLSQ